MTKKDFELIASVLRPFTRADNEHDLYDCGWTGAGRAIVHEFADALERQYKGSYSFNRQRFYEACGL